MEPFSVLTAVAAPIDDPNVDTDQLIPIHRLRDMRAARGSFGGSLFYDRRFDANGSPRPDFILNLPTFENTRILVTNDNFGCGSSREAAVWALHDFGIRTLIGPGFGDIFLGNCAENGILVVSLPAIDCSRMRAALHASPGTTITVDLPAQSVRMEGDKPHHFIIDSFRKECLLRGVDELGLSLDRLSEIRAWEAARAIHSPWLR